MLTGLTLAGLLARVLGWGRSLTTGNAGAALGLGALAAALAVAAGLALWAFWPRHDQTAAAELARGVEAERAATLTRAIEEAKAAREREAAVREERDAYREQVGELATQIAEAMAAEPGAAEVRALPDDIVARVAARERLANARNGNGERK